MQIEHSESSTNFKRIFCSVMAFLMFVWTAPPAHALSAPTITPGTGGFVNAQTVTMSAASGAIFYTTDGSVPTNSSTAYGAPFQIESATQINAVAFLSGTYSPVTTVYLDVDPALTPILSPAGLILRLDAGLGATPTSTGTVNFWADLSGLNNNAVSNGHNPALVASAINDYPAVSFNGSQSLSLPSGFANFTTITQVTVGNVASPSAPGNGERITINGNIAQYVVLTTSTDATVATGLAAAVNALALGGVSATATGAVVKITAPLATVITTTPLGGVTLALQPPGCTVFIVTQPNSLSSGQQLIDLSNAVVGNDVTLQIGSSSLGQFSSFSGTSGTNVSSATALTNNSYQVLAASQSAGATLGSATFYLNGVASTPNNSMNNIPNITRTSNFVGQGTATTSFYRGSICELLLYSTSLSNSQINSIVGMLSQKYQITSQAPAAPIISVPSGVLGGPIQVSISAEAGAVPRFTVDGNVPTLASPAFSGTPLQINYTQTLKVVSFKNGVASSMSSATYTLDSSQFPAPNPSDMTAPTINLVLPTPSI